MPAEIRWEAVDGTGDYDWNEGLRRRLAGEHVAPRWKGNPCRWYICAFCNFQVQLGSPLPTNAELPPDWPTTSRARAMGRYIIHECTPGLRANVQELSWSKQPGYAYICAPWHAIDGLRALHQAPSACEPMTCPAP